MISAPQMGHNLPSGSDDKSKLGLRLNEEVASVLCLSLGVNK
jgi:hypothetical protein